MKKTIMFSVFALLVISMFGIASARAPSTPFQTPILLSTPTPIPEEICGSQYSGECGAKTMITGRVYYTYDNSSVVGATVRAECKDFISMNTYTDDSGVYVIYAPVEECTNGDLVTTFAEKNGIEGENTGYIGSSVVDVAFVDVPLVPEFGVIVGLATLLGAVGVFFVVRRK